MVDSATAGTAVGDLDAAAIRAALRTQRLGCRIIILARTSSTMDELADRARHGAPEGTVVIADEQTAGRGRLGRRWLAPPGSSLLMSVLFRPPLPPLRGSQVSMAVALGALQALSPLVPAEPALKWPNDLVVEGAKIGGLLAEAHWSEHGGQVIVGLGLNVHQRTGLLPGSTSLVLAGARSPDRSRLAAGLLNAADRYYQALLAGASLHEEWARRLDTLGRDIEARGPEGVIRGQAIGVAPDGGLQVRTAEGETVTLRAADVTLRPAVQPR